MALLQKDYIPLLAVGFGVPFYLLYFLVTREEVNVDIHSSIYLVTKFSRLWRWDSSESCLILEWLLKQ